MLNESQVYIDRLLLNESHEISVSHVLESRRESRSWVWLLVA